MPLSPEAQQIVDASARRMGRPMYEIPVPELRAVLAAGAIPATTPIHHSEDLLVPSAAGGVPIRIYRPSDDEGLPVVQWMHSGGFAVGVSTRTRSTSAGSATLPASSSSPSTTDWRRNIDIPRRSTTAARYGSG